MPGRPRSRAKRQALTNALPSTSSPEAQAATQLVRSASEDVRLQIVCAILIECGFDERVIEMLLRRLGASDWVVDDLEPLGDQELKDELGRKQRLILSRLDDVAIAQATPQQLSVAFGILTDKRLLYEGRPTAIVSNEERRALDELMPELVKEAARRGIALELPPMIEVEWRETKNPEGEDKSGGAI